MRLVIDLQACQSSGNRIRGIGRYSLALAQAMVRNAGNHECVIALNAAIADSVEPMRAAFTELLPADRIRSWASVAKIAEAFHGGAPRSQAAGELFRQAMREFRPDFVHITSVFEGSDSDVTNVVGSSAEGLPTAVTLYDLIPLAQSDVYLAQPAVRDWYMRRLEQLKRAELLLAISAFTKGEGVDLLGIEADRIVNIRGACDDVFQPVSLTDERRLALYGRYGIHRPYLMYAGGFDSRKNILSLIRAYAALPQAVRDSHQLLIVGSPPAMERKQIEALRSQLGLREDQCVLLGYVSDRDLAALYSDCRLYAFPSLQEGFGLPALEA
ncbi:glycosyltransferase family 1 protein, partial [Dyella sp. C9]|uniref:glycosyltransferase family 4 protein n=1 Tax=Dyella sp. C9 TaxID=2202154 RepID=UPI0018E4E31E